MTTDKCKTMLIGKQNTQYCDLQTETRKFHNSPNFGGHPMAGSAVLLLSAVVVGHQLRLL